MLGFCFQMPWVALALARALDYGGCMYTTTATTDARGACLLTTGKRSLIFHREPPQLDEALMGPTSEVLIRTWSFSYATTSVIAYRIKLWLKRK